MTSIPIERQVEQVKEGQRYKGYIKIFETSFDYEVVFEVPIYELESLGPPEGEEDMRRIFQINLKSDEKNIDLSWDEFGFFFQMLVEFAVDFYQKELAGCGGDRLERSGLVKIERIDNDNFNLSPKLCKLLNAPKFNCKIPTGQKGDKKMVKVTIGQQTQEIKKGRHYKGNVDIAGAYFEYDIVFGIPIDQVHEKEFGNESEMRQTFPLSLKHGDQFIRLTSDEYAFFISLFAGIAESLFQRPADSPPPSKLSTECTLPFNLIEALKSPRFGCNTIITE